MSSKKSKQKRKSEGAVRSKGFWNNGGMEVMPAVNLGRPFDFQIGNPTGQYVTNPYAFGNAQYIVTNFKVPTDWYNVTSFDTTATKLYQSIRQNLRSNLAYTEEELRAYLMNVMWLQAACSMVGRDFVWKKYRDPQHPTFEHVWGNEVQAREYNYANGLEPDVLVSEISKKVYIDDSSYAENLTYYETVLLPTLSLLSIPPAIAEYCKWLFGNVFIDEVSSAHSQFYWNELNALHLYEYDKATNTTSLSATVDVTLIDLPMLAGIISSIASSFGVVIADLKRAHAQMVTLYMPNPSDDCVLRYDDTFFTALENAFTGGYVASNNGVLHEAQQQFFLVDFIPGMNSEQMNTSLSLMGALSPTNSVLAKPLRVISQNVLVEIDRPTSLVLGAITVDATGTISVPSTYGPGVYAMKYCTPCGGYVAHDDSGYVQKETSMTQGNARYFTLGEMSASVSGWALVDDWSNVNSVMVPCGTAMINGSLKLTYFAIDSSTLTYSKTTSRGLNVHRVYGTGSLLGMAFDPVKYFPTTTAERGSDFCHATSSNKDQVRVEIVWYTPGSSQGSPGTQLYKATINLGITTIGNSYTAGNTASSISLFGTMVIGSQVATSTITMLDASHCLMQWIEGEVEHHIPLWNTQKHHDVDNATSTAIWPELIKCTNVSTSYSVTELESLLYQLYYSLFFVHATQVYNDKKA